MVYGNVETSCVALQNLPVKNYSNGKLQDHSELKKHLVCRGYSGYRKQHLKKFVEDI